MSGSRISFATIDLSVNAARRKLRTKADPRSPARQLTPQEIIEHIPEGDDGMLWGAYEIPIYLDPPLDRSNSPALDIVATGLTPLGLSLWVGRRRVTFA